MGVKLSSQRVVRSYDEIRATLWSVKPSEAAQWAVAERDRTGALIVFTLNGTEVPVTKGMSAEDVEGKYHEERLSQQEPTSLVPYSIE